MTKIVGTLGPKSQSVEVISSCLEAGMSVARCDFLLGDNKYHQETLDNLKTSIKSTKKLCAVNVADPELAVVNTSEKPITLKADETVTIIPDKGEKSSFEVFPINFDGLSKVDQVKGDDVVCVIKNSVMLTGSLFTLHAAQIHINLPTLPDNDKETRELLGKLGDLSQTQIFAKIESEKGLTHCDEILQEVDGIYSCDDVVDFLMRFELVRGYYLALGGKFGISPNLCTTVGLLMMILLARELNCDYESFKVVLPGKSTILPPMGVLSLGGQTLVFHAAHVGLSVIGNSPVHKSMFLELSSRFES
ncbi:hypothetical protein BC332_07963 [Capsicum chinense]|nr:hypothetical protein BC332_07963 [Capsicum chinense]